MKTSVLVILLVISMAADAGRGKKQNKRIKSGLNNGSLTTREANKLNKQQENIRENRQDYLADGELDKKDKAKLKNQRDRASKNIYKQKHDKQDKQDNE